MFIYIEPKILLLDEATSILLQNLNYQKKTN
jgi:ABC-type methionine transport system ATPase subunit